MFTCKVNEHITIRLLEPKDAERLAELIIQNQQRLGQWLFFAENPAALKRTEKQSFQIGGASMPT